jgi:hypothetical protein
MTTITRVYSTYEKATEVVRDLEAADISHSDITLVAQRSQDRHSAIRDYSTVNSEKAAADEAVYDTAVGTGVVGGLTGLLAGLGLIAIPGLGPVVAAGWLGATLFGFTAGAAGGTVVEVISNALSGHGVHKDEARSYATSVAQGGTLVAVKTDDSKRSTVESIMGLNDESSFTASSSRAL